MRNLKLCLAVPTYNRCDLIGGSIDSIFRAEIPPEISRIRLLVINNNCTDATQETVNRRTGTGPFELRQIYEKQQGLCYCRNRAIKEAQCDDFVVLLDDDIQLHSHWLFGLVNCIEEFGADCVVGPVHARFKGKLPQFMTEKAIRSISSPYSLKGSKAFRLPNQMAHEIPGCNFAVSVVAANAVGGFNTSLDRVGKDLVAGGDRDFGNRLRKANFSVCYHPDCGIDHIISSEKLTREYLMRRWYGVGMTLRLMPSPLYRSRLTSFRYGVDIIRVLLKHSLRRFLGNPAIAFDDELELSKLRGFLGRPFK